MDFIEKWLHLSPDGGSGSVELMIWLVAAAVGVRGYFGRRRRRSLSREA